jgi:ArsR family transcriptional regulator
LRSGQLTWGTYTAVFNYGWTEFDIDDEIQALRVTTYGSDSYTQAELEAGGPTPAANDQPLCGYAPITTPQACTRASGHRAGCLGARRGLACPLYNFQIFLNIWLTIYMFLHIFLFAMIDANTFFSALASDIRLRCLVLMQLQGELCVCELTHSLDLSQPMISRHLASLRETGLVQTRRAGQWMYYTLHPDLPSWAKNVIRETADANAQESPYADDLYALKEMPNRPGAACCA